MIGFAFLMAGLLAVSGGLKARSGSRMGLGLLPGSLLEMLAAVGFALGAVAGFAPSFWALVAGTMLLVASSAHHAVALRKAARSREESEGGRLAAYVKYLSRPDRDDR